MISHIKYVALALLLFTLSCAANAGCQDIASYKDKKIAIDISDGGCRTTDPKIIYAKVTNGNPNWDLARELDFYEECQFSKDMKFLSCRVNRKNPLSGATYERVQNGFEKCSNYAAGERYPAYVLRCIKGCNRAPREMTESYGCD